MNTLPQRKAAAQRFAAIVTDVFGVEPVIEHHPRNAFGPGCSRVRCPDVMTKYGLMALSFEANPRCGHVYSNFRTRLPDDVFLPMGLASLNPYTRGKWNALTEDIDAILDDFEYRMRAIAPVKDEAA